MEASDRQFSEFDPSWGRSSKTRTNAGHVAIWDTIEYDGSPVYIPTVYTRIQQYRPYIHSIYHYIDVDQARKAHVSTRVNKTAGRNKFIINLGKYLPNQYLSRYTKSTQFFTILVLFKILFSMCEDHFYPRSRRAEESCDLFDQSVKTITVREVYLLVGPCSGAPLPPAAAIGRRPRRAVV